MIKKINKNYLFLIFIVPFIFICFSNKTPDNDIWFLLNNGRYVLNHGIPSIDPFTIHEGLEYVMQQWLSASIFYGIYHMFGKCGILILIYLMSFVLMFVFYKLCYVISEKKVSSILITVLAFILISKYIIVRPQVFTYLILVLEILMVELYIKKKNNKYLYILPFLSVLLVNLHASMWFFQFIFMLPFLFNALKIKNITLDDVKIKELIIVIVLMFIGGFINPYGYKAIVFIFKSYGIQEINREIIEMQAPTFELFHVKIMLCLLFLVLCICNFRKDLKLDIRHFLFICGVTLLAFMHRKCYPYFVLIFLYCFSYLIKNYELKIKFNINKYIRAILNGLKIGISLALVMTFFVTIYYSLKNYSFDNYEIKDITDYIEENFDKENMILYVDFNYGGYTEYLGMKSYIDGRAELFFKCFNGKEDIFKEWLNIYNDIPGFDYESFVNKYQFTHIITKSYNSFDEYLSSSDKYKLHYIKYFDEDTKELELKKLYVLKDLEG